jgi:hypothetical protein
MTCEPRCTHVDHKSQLRLDAGSIASATDQCEGIRRTAHSSPMAVTRPLATSFRGSCAHENQDERHLAWCHQHGGSCRDDH